MALLFGDAMNSYHRFQRHDTPKGRYYRVVDKEKTELGYFPSVTTVLQIKAKRELEVWMGNQPSYAIACQTRDARGVIGTAVHVAISRLLLGKEIDTNIPLTWDDDSNSHSWTTETKKMLMGFQQWVLDHQPLDPICIEQPLFYQNRDIKYAGCVDLIARVGDRIVLVDWKTSKSLYRTSDEQVMAYAKAAHHTFGLVVDEIAPVRLYEWKGIPKYQHRAIKPDDYNHIFERFEATARLWRLENRDPDFGAEQKTLPTQFSIKDLLPNKKATSKKEAVSG